MGSAPPDPERSTPMGHYRSNLTDTEFTLFDVFGRGDLLGSGPYADLDEDTAREALTEIDRLARDEIAASFEHGDRNPPDYDPTTGEVHLSDEFRRSFDAWMNSEWWRLEIPAELGGQPCPPSLRWAVAELALGANPALFMYASGPQFAHAIWRNGTAEQKRLAQRMVDNHWAATMVLTEPDAGSDVGAGRAKAYPQPDGTWHLEGVKRFITSGEHDLTSNIVHLVLARPVGVEGAGGPGTKGLSLFLVPKYHVDPETGELGDRNGVKATNVEHKMGLKVSATCELTFGGDTPAVGTLLGDVHDGIAQMFQIIEYARMLVGTKAIGTLSSGYLNALEYAKERVQGADMTRSGDKSAPRVTITNHPDVRRSLMAQKAYAEGLRALVIYTATVQDDVELASASGTDNADAERLNDLLLPLVKGYGSEKAWVLLGTEGLQTFGGSGFLQDYPLEQYVRDAKIDTLYEGTTAIQGLDLFFRKIVKDNGQALGQLAGEIGKFAHASGVSGDSADSSDADGDDVDGDQLRTERQLLARALEDAQAMVGGLITNAMRSNPKFAPDGEADPSELYTVGAHTSRLLLSLGDVVCAWLLLRKAEIAQAKLAELEGSGSGREAADQQGVSGGAQGATGGRGAADARGADFYRGKVAAARWFCREVLPKLSAERQIVESADNSLMDLPESAF